MKQPLHILLTLVFVLMGLSFAQAQEKKAKTNVNKELKKVLKDLPVETQMQVLKYAERKRAAIEKVAAQKLAREEAAKVAAASQAKPAQAVDRTAAQQKIKGEGTAPANPRPAQPIELKPDRTGGATFEAPTSTAPAQPKRPKYMLDAENMAPTTVEWESTSYNFGSVKTGDVVKYTYKFKNTGDKPLKLTRVKASCGCTTPKWTQEEIAPGEEGYIDVSFNTRGKSGMQSKSVTVTGNFEPITTILRLRGEVKTN